jgi:hypothetical protein
MKFRLSQRYSNFFVLVVMICQGVVGLFVAAAVLSLVAIAFGAGSLVVLWWSSGWVWLGRAVVMMVVFLFAGTLYEGLRPIN